MVDATLRWPVKFCPVPLAMGKEPRAAGAVPMDSDGALEIVPMTLEDTPAVLEIERGAHVQPWQASFFIEELRRPQSRAYVVRHKDVPPADRILGYICFWMVADEIQIFNLAVDIAYRRRGIGKALLLHALEVGYQHRARVAVLEVRRGNDAARRLYGSLGFQQAGQRKNYYSELREPALLMELEMDLSRLGIPERPPAAGVRAAKEPPA